MTTNTFKEEQLTPILDDIARDVNVSEAFTDIEKLMESLKD